MTERCEIVAVVVVALAATVSVRADTMPVSRLDAGSRQSSCAHDRTQPQLTPCSGSLTFRSRVFDVILCETRMDAGRTREIQPPPLLAGCGSILSLCLCGLIGLGAFQSVRWTRKLSFDFVPDWRRRDSHFPMGHSHVSGPDLRFAPSCWFIQPDCTAADCQPEYSRGTIASLLRRSQFSSTVLTSRGPP
jgi:hypothetical protein